jgi:hypothetical protein
MGFSITWLAVREAAAPKLLERLALYPTGKTEEFPESLISAAKLDTGWRVIWYNKYGCPFLGPEALGEISKEQDVLLCLIEEHVMASSSEFWSAGNRIWRISHEGENGPKGLATDGDLPVCFPSIRRELEETQLAEGGDDADVDHIFDIPLKVAQSLVGFKHDEDCPHLVEKEFVVLSRAGPKKGILASLFGR